MKAFIIEIECLKKLKIITDNLLVEYAEPQEDLSEEEEKAFLKRFLLDLRKDFLSFCESNKEILKEHEKDLADVIYIGKDLIDAYEHSVDIFSNRCFGWLRRLLVKLNLDIEPWIMNPRKNNRAHKKEVE